MTNFIVCTYDMGKNYSSYDHLCNSHEFSSRVKNSKRSSYEEIQKKTAQLLANKADVYFFQGVGRIDRHLINQLKANNYAIISFQNAENIDTAIGLNSKRFTDIMNLSESYPNFSKKNMDVAIAVATDRETQQNIVFASGWTQGFDSQPGVFSPDNFYCEKMIERLEALKQCQLQVVGINTNANSEQLEEEVCSFEKNGYTAIRSHQPTKVTFHDGEGKVAPHVQEIETDLFFFKENASLIKNVKSTFFKTMQNSAELISFQPLGMNPTRNASNHLPLLARIKNTLEQPSLQPDTALMVLTGLACVVGSAFLAFKQAPH